MDYCNDVLHGAPTGSIQKLQGVRNNVAWIVLQASRRSRAKPLLHQLHWLPVLQRSGITIQVGSSDVRSWEHVHSILPAPTNHGRCLQPNSTFICHPSRCRSNRSPGQIFPGVLSDFLYRLPGTRCHKQF